MNASGWADDAVNHLKRVADAAKNVRPVAVAGDIQAQTPVSDRAMLMALAEALKSDNSMTQAIAVRIANLAARYPNKAY